METEVAALIVVVTLLVIVIFSEQIIYLIMAAKATFISLLTGENPEEVSYQEYGSEDMKNNPKKAAKTHLTGTAQENATALGISSTLPWDEVIKVTELDPATFINQQEFVKDVRIFSSGANFTSVSDSNNSDAFVNFVGLVRPEAYVGMIGASARQVPDVDETVLTRNMYPFRRFLNS